jgi:putative endonuclease
MLMSLSLQTVCRLCKRQSALQTIGKKNNSTHSVGTAGENCAAEYLCAHGFVIIGRNWRTRNGEIDIIAQSDSLIVFAEVKTLPSGGLETLSHELNAKKQKRIIETAKRFLAKHREYSNSVVRFDVLVIDMPGLAPVYHIENAFSELV